jgi:hypothetical protein
MISDYVRGSPRDIPIVLITVFSITLFSIAMFTGVSSFNDQIQELNESESSLNMDTSAKFVHETTNVFGLVDAGAIILIGAFFLGSIYSALQITSSKIFIVPSLLFLIASLYLAGIMSNLYFMIAETPALVSYFNAFPYSTQVMNNFGLLTGVLGMVLLAATYLRNPGTTEVGI